jgi:hypothetical protein
MIKPYVSGSRGSWEVLNANGKVDATFSNINAACNYLHGNWDKLCRERKPSKRREIGGAE